MSDSKEPWWAGLENLPGCESLKNLDDWKDGDLFFEYSQVYANPEFNADEEWIESTYLPALFSNTITLSKFLDQHPSQREMMMLQCGGGGPLMDIVPSAKRVEVYERYRLQYPNEVVSGFLEIYETTRELIKWCIDESNMVSLMMTSSILHFAIQHEVRAINGLRMPWYQILEMLAQHLDDERYFERFSLLKGFLIAKQNPELALKIWRKSENLNTDATMLLVRAYHNIDIDPEKAYEELLDSVEVSPSMHTFLAYNRLAHLWWSLLLNPKKVHQADEVILQGLSSKKGKLLNGKEGVVIQKLENGRIQVEIAGKSRMSFQEKNLQRKHSSNWHYIGKYAELFCENAPRDQILLPSTYYLLIEARIKEFYGGGADRPIVNGHRRMLVPPERDPLEPRKLRKLINKAISCEKELRKLCPELMKEYDYRDNCRYYVYHLYSHMEEIERNWTPIDECFRAKDRFDEICPCRCFDNAKCRVCKKACKALVCSRCGCAYYCGPEHQKQDWKNHKQWCKKHKKHSKNFVPFWNFSTYKERMGKKGAKDWKKWNLKQGGRKDVVKYETNI